MRIEPFKIATGMLSDTDFDELQVSLIEDCSGDQRLVAGAFGLDLLDVESDEEEEEVY